MKQTNRKKKTTFYGDPRLKRIRDIKELRAALEKAVAIAASLAYENQDFEYLQDQIDEVLTSFNLLQPVGVQNAQ